MEKSQQVEYFCLDTGQYIPCQIEKQHSMEVYMVTIKDPKTQKQVLRMAFKKELKFTSENKV